MSHDPALGPDLPRLSDLKRPADLRCVPNPHRGVPGLVTLNAAGFRRARAEIEGWAGYAPTPLVRLPGIAAAAGVADLWIKDEAGRFGLGSFKALGGAYAVLGVVRAALSRRDVVGAVTAADLEAGAHRDLVRGVTVCCATDGNHGRSVAWGARRFGARCVIYVHAGVSAGRISAIEAYGAEVRVVAGTYDDSVLAATAAAEAGGAAGAVAGGWVVVSDTSWTGYTEIPREVMQGYRLMAAEAFEAWAHKAGDQAPTHVFIQGGVGGVAAAVAVQARAHYGGGGGGGGGGPAVVVVEPERAACLMLSAEAGRAVKAPGALDTIMAGLACGEPSLLAWQELERSASAFLAIGDDIAVEGMRALAAVGVVSGESGAAGLAGFMAVTMGAAAATGLMRMALGLDAQSRVLAFSTEGATDPDLYARLVG